MKQLIGILAVIMLFASCSKDERETEHENIFPTLSTDHLDMLVGETQTVEIRDLDRATLSDLSISGENNIVESVLRNKSIVVTAIHAGETILTVKPGKYTPLTLKIVVSSGPEPENIFNDATPRFESNELVINCDNPGIMVFHINSPYEWQIKDLNNGNSIKLTEKSLFINNLSYSVTSIEQFENKDQDVNFIKVSLINNQVAWLVVRKEQ